MARRSRTGDPKRLFHELASQLDIFGRRLSETDDARELVRLLVPVLHLVRDLGSSVVGGEQTSAKDRIRAYLRSNVGQVVSSEELALAGGIQEHARRIRELRVEEGFRIFSGYAIREMREDESGQGVETRLPDMSPDEYLLLEAEPDQELANRWADANRIRRDRSKGSKESILSFLRLHVGEVVTGEELRYVASDASEWARRTRELRTEEGWPIVTQFTGRPDLPQGVYVLEADRQTPVHDRRISDRVRIAVLRRDGYRCCDCGWRHEEWNRSDPRHLEAHHVERHVDGGESIPENLVTLCNHCHDERHANE